MISLFPSCTFVICPIPCIFLEIHSAFMNSMPTLISITNSSFLLRIFYTAGCKKLFQTVLEEHLCFMLASNAVEQLTIEHLSRYSVVINTITQPVQQSLRWWMQIVLDFWVPQCLACEINTKNDLKHHFWNLSRASQHMQFATHVPQDYSRHFST